MKKLIILPLLMIMNACTVTKPDSHAYTYIYQHNSNNRNSNNTAPVNTSSRNNQFEENNQEQYQRTPQISTPVYKRKNTEEVLFSQDEEYLKSNLPVKDNQGIPQGYYSGWGYVTVPKTERLSDGRVIQHNHYYPAESFGVGIR